MIKRYLATKPMVARDHQQHHRVATPLELYFDLVFVIAIAATASGLHHALAAHHLLQGVATFSFCFFTVWWAWMNFTWFASAYDTDDTAYRIVTMVQMFGALILAVSINEVFHNGSMKNMLWGFVIMRLAQAYQWFRAAKNDSARKATCQRYGYGLIITQILWAIVVFVLTDYAYYLLPLMMLIELSVPLWAERKEATSWHPHHIAERYGLLAIILLGEGLLGITNAITPLLRSEISLLTEALPLGLGISAIMFSLWWLYFKMPFAQLLEQRRTFKAAFFFGYGHYFVFIALAAVGSALELLADTVTQLNSTTAAEHPVSPLFAMATLTTAIAIYLTSLTFIRRRLSEQRHYNLIGYWLGIMATFLAIAAVYCGLDLVWAIWFTVIAPVVMILIHQKGDQ